MRYPWNGGKLKLTAIYPEEYPYFHPRVIAPGLELARHINPVSNDLCLIGDRTDEWNPEDTLASYLDTRLPVVFSDQGTETSQTLEEQAAPDSLFLHHAPGSFLLVDGDWKWTSGNGKLRIAAEIDLFGSSYRIRGVVLDVRTNTNGIRFHWTGTRPHHYGINISAPFSNVGKLQLVDDPSEHLAMISVMNPNLAARNWISDNQGNKFAVIGITFQEEIGINTLGPGWMFFLIRQGNNSTEETVQRIRSYRAGPGDFGMRVPANMTLRGKRILLAGCGAIGAPIAIELARCGAIIRVLDHDVVEPAQSVRWPLGMPSYGLLKSEELKKFILENFPHATIEAINLEIGAAPEIGGFEQSTVYREQLGKALTGNDIIIDATAEVGVQQYLSACANHAKIPYLFASATPGAVGGMVGRFIPEDDQGCWFCLQRAIHSKVRSERTIPEPKKDITGHVLVPGCNHPTFTGAAFDLAEVGLQAVRMATQSFDADSATAFASMEFEGPLSLPVWKSHAVPRYEGCPHCNR